MNTKKECTTKTLRRARSFILCLTWGMLSSLVVGCGTQEGRIDEQPDPVGHTEKQQPVINGTPFQNTDRLALMSTPGCNGMGVMCTGTMITNDWVLSSAQCGYACQPADATTVSLNGQNIVGARVVNHPSLDFALIKLAAPMTINGSTTGFQSSMYTHTAESLMGQTVEIQGYGVSDCAGGGVGIMRYGHMTAAAFPNQYNITYQALSGQTTGAGDAGGPFWKFFRGVPYQVSVGRASACGVESYAARPENFEQWVFDVVYNGPIHMPTTDAQGRGLWSIPGPDPQFWQSPLQPNRYVSTPYFDPCPGSANEYQWTAEYYLIPNFDWMFIGTDYGVQWMTGTTYVPPTTTMATGKGSMFIGYRTNPWYAVSAGMKSMTVQCDYGPQNAELVCHGARCATTRDPLPNNFYDIKNWDPCGGGDFWFGIDYDFEEDNDFALVGTSRFTGKGTTGQYSPGPTTVTVFTNPTIRSHGIKSLKAVCNGW